MKLITLNAWGGRVRMPLIDFIQKQKDIDVWCFQEVYNGRIVNNDNIDRTAVDFDLFNTLKSVLPRHTPEFCQTIGGLYGLATFVNKDLPILEKGESFVARGNWRDMNDLYNRDHHRKIFWIETLIDGKEILIVNTHLTHRPEGKTDSDKRLKQSKIIIDFLSLFDCPKIICGDFNLLPDTQSIRMFEDFGMINLIKKYDIKATRTSLYKKPLMFADYIFVTSDIKVNNFLALSDVVSDHSPLLLDFNV